MIITFLNSGSSKHIFKITAIDLLESRRDRADELLKRLDDARIGFTEGSAIPIEFKTPNQVICSFLNLASL